MAHSVQPATVAGRFYPAEAERCARLIDACLARAAPPEIAAKAVIAPHAGYVSSGPVAASAYALLTPRRAQTRRVVVLGPSHRTALEGCVLPPAASWATPLGELAIDRVAIARLSAHPGFRVAAEPFAEEHSLDVQMPFIRHAIGEVQVVPVLVGACAASTVSSALNAVWGGAETAIVVSSDLCHFLDAAAARAKDEGTARLIECLQGDRLAPDLACGRHAIAGLLDQARRRDLRATAIDLRNSADTRGGSERVVGYGAIGFEPVDEARLDLRSRHAALDLARKIINLAAGASEPPKVEVARAVVPMLAAMRACFVTLELDGRLRGCTGSMVAQRPLAEDIAVNAFKAAFADRGAGRPTPAELERMAIHIAVLSTPRAIAASHDGTLLAALRPGIDGLIVDDRGRRALFLPRVWRTLASPQDFLAALKRKAGLAADHWSEGFRAFRFTTEDFDGVPAQRAAA
jgi:AmmeMemoRadiSam system protein B/AmmeMemoRadiSam system protein A